MQSKYFKLSEFEKAPSASRLKLPSSVNKIPDEVLLFIEELAQNLDVLREELKVPVRIVSGYRSPAYNKAVGGVQNSMHMQGKAADIQVDGLPPATVHNMIEKLISIGAMKQGGLGLYKTFVHYDIRGTKARWYK